MAAHRSHFRNVFFYDATKPNDEPLGGFTQNGAISEAMFLEILKTILLVTKYDITVKSRTSDYTVTLCDKSLPTDEYNIFCDDPIRLTDEVFIKRIASSSLSGREDSFRDGIRARDGRCVISGVANPHAPYEWFSFEAAHVFPAEKDILWQEWDFGRWITDIEDVAGATKIHSCQNGFLLKSDVHKAFDQYRISVNPDAGYKIVVFGIDFLGVDGRILEECCRRKDDPHKVSEELLRYHFRTSVLANMRGAGEASMEFDFPHGSDMIKEISNAPDGQERFEMELAARLSYLSV